MDALAQCIAWLSWLPNGPAAGLGRLHRLSRVSACWIPSIVGRVRDFDYAEDHDPVLGSVGMAESFCVDDQSQPLHNQLAVEEEALKWAIE